MAEPKLRTFVIQQPNEEPIELKAERAEHEGQGSTRVTFFIGEDVVASFINLTGWYTKA